MSPITSGQNIVETFDAVERIRSRIKIEEARLKKSRITTTVTPRTPIHITGDAVKYEQLISNLLLNAIDAIKDRKNAPNRRVAFTV